MNDIRNIYGRRRFRAVLLVTAIIVVSANSTRLQADTGTCGGASITLPFTDVPAANLFFCSIAEAYFSGLANGTTGTTYAPAANVTRDQMAAFITRTMDQSLKRGSQRAILDQFWTTQGANNLALTTVGTNPLLVQSDGADLWVASGGGGGTVSRVRASDGKLLETWTSAPAAYGLLCAIGKVFITGQTTPGQLYQIDPTQTPGAVTVLSTSLGANAHSLAYDGLRIWTANAGPPTGSVSIVTLNPTVVTNVTAGFISPGGVIYDGANIWVTDDPGGPPGKLYKLNPAGGIVQTVDVGGLPLFPAFDGANIWVPNLSTNSVSVVRATGSLAGTVLATLSGNGLDGPHQAAFDGERMLVVNFSGHSVSVWKASDFTPIGAFSTGTGISPWGACGDGLSFWITLSNGKLARF